MIISNQRRKEVQKLAARIIEDEWEDDLRDHIARHVDAERQIKWTFTDTGFNVVKALTTGLSTQYDTPPTLTGDAGFIDLLNKSKLWSMMPDFQRNKLAIREMAMRILVNARTGKIGFIPVYPHELDIKVDPTDPDRIIYLEHSGVWQVKDKEIPICQIWDITDLDNKPYFQVVSKEGGKEVDLTAFFLEDKNQPLEPYLMNGEPFIPYVLAHATQTGKLWNPSTAQQLANVNLNIGMQFSFYDHALYRASWNQVVFIGCMPAGSEAKAIYRDGTDEILGWTQIKGLNLDPAKAMQVIHLDPDRPGSVQQLSAPTNPHEMIMSIENYVRQGMQILGINGANLVRQTSDPRSGIALAIDREAQRAEQRRAEPHCRAADLDLISKTAAMYNSVMKTNFAEDGYNIKYTAIPPSIQDEQQTQNRVSYLVDNEYITKSRAMTYLFPELSDEERQLLLSEVEAEKAMKEANEMKEPENEMESMPQSGDMEPNEDMPEMEK